MSQSHTATEQWQSFEFRMRRRRFERCALRAAAAMDAGVFDVAREALDEARLLSADDPQIAELESRFAIESTSPLLLREEPEPVAVAETPPSRGRGLQVAAAITFIAASGAAGWFMAEPPDQSGVVARATAARTTATPAVGEASGINPPTAAAPAAGSIAAPPSSDVPETAGPGEPTPQPTTGSVAASPTGSQPSAPISGTPLPSVVPAAPNLTAPASVTPSLPSESAASLPAAADASRPATDAVVPPPPSAPESAVAMTGLDANVGTSAAVRAPVVSAPAPAASAAPAAGGAAVTERGVRATLGRYERAYNSLDAVAARTVYPTVDQRALARAFEGLSSQQVSLGTCDVRVNGATAQADCAGTASWTPKVGGGVQSAHRRWRFDLATSGDEWVIVRATAR